MGGAVGAYPVGKSNRLLVPFIGDPFPCLSTNCHTAQGGTATNESSTMVGNDRHGVLELFTG